MFLIPFNLQLISNVDSDIYFSFSKEKQYNIKSKVCNDTFQSFLNHWFYNKIPDLKLNNISEYFQLSEEFDRMNNLIEIFHKASSNIDLLTYRSNYKTILNQKHCNLDEIKNNFQQIIHFLFKNNKIAFYSNYIKEKIELYDTYINDDAKMVFLLTRKEVKENGLSFILNEKEKEAPIFRNISAVGDIIIPQFIKFNEQEYMITSILEKAFKNSQEIQSIQFVINSKLRLIEKEAFMNSSLINILLPDHLKYQFVNN